MKMLLVPCLLLLFGTCLNSGHYIRDPEYNPNVYNVQEGSGLAFVNPKPEKPTLREILYYHIIERLREEPAVTERSFTNDHGYQFLEPEEYDTGEIEHDDMEVKHADDNDEFRKEDNQFNEEEPETTTEAKPLTDEDVKEANKARSYLFDQMRQRYAVKRMASLNRRKRQAEMQNLNNPQSFYELGPNNGNQNEGQFESTQNQENIPPPSERVYIPPTSDSGSLEDIYVNTYRPSAIPLETEPEPAYPEAVNDNPEPIINPEVSDSQANYPVEPIIGNYEVSNEGAIEPKVYEDPEPNYPVEPIVDNGPIESATQEEPQAENPISEGSVETVGGSNENPGLGYGQSELEPKPESSPDESFGGEKIKEIPEAPTPSPLNYDNLPDYIREAISYTEKPTYEQTDSPYFNPQPSPEDKKVMEDNMEDIFASLQPVEDIPKTYGMSLTSDGGHVWNEHKEEQLQTPTEQPEIHEEPEYPISEPAEPEKEEPIPNPEEPQEPEIRDSEEAKNPIEEQKQAPTEEPEINEEPENPILEPAEPEKEEPIPNLEEPQVPEIYDSEEAKNPTEEQTQAPTEQPEINEEPEYPILEPAEPEKKEPISNPEEPQEPEIHVSEEAKNPIEEPIPSPKPENGEPEEPISNPSEDVLWILWPGNKPKPQPENEDKPIEEPAQTVEPLEPEPTIELEPKLIPEPRNGDNHEIGESEQSGDVEEPSDDNGDHLEEPVNEPVEQPEEETKPDIMSELLKSKQFWKWLGEWTATYMELLEKHIRKIAIQEICKRKKAGDEMCPLEDNPEDTGVIVKDDRIVVDGREIYITHTDNLDGELKVHNNKKEKQNKNENKIEASTMYGNSVGNEKVTNIFIFTANNAEEVVDKLKPANDSKVDFVIDERIKEENKDESNKSIEDESKLQSNIDDKEANEGAINKEEIKNEEANEGEVIKEEPNVSEANTEKLNKRKCH